MKHNYQTPFISGIDASNPDTFPFLGKTHPVEFIEPDDAQSDYHRGAADVMRALQRSLEWLWYAKSHDQRHNRMIGLFYNLNMEYILNERSSLHILVSISCFFVLSFFAIPISV